MWKGRPDIILMELNPKSYEEYLKANPGIKGRSAGAFSIQKSGGANPQAERSAEQGTVGGSGVVGEHEDGNDTRKSGEPKLRTKGAGRGRC